MVERGLLVCVGAVGAMLGADEPRAPYPQSECIVGMNFAAASERVLAPGSDIWPLTWVADGNQHAVFGDGGGLGGTNRARAHEG